VRVALRIDELVLDGFAHADRISVGAAAERELGRLVAERGLPGTLRADASVARIDGGAHALAADAGSDAIGAAVARSVYGGLAR
jgi:hypothetical protein